MINTIFPNSGSSAIRNWQIKIFASTWLTYAGLYFCRHAFFVVKKDLQTAMDWDVRTLGILGSAYLISYAAGQFINGMVGIKFGNRILLLSGMLLSITANLVFGMANSFAIVILFMIINGLAQASGWPGCIGTMGAWFTQRDKRGKIMGWWSTCYQLGGIAAKLYAAFLLGKWGWESSFFGASVILLLVWFIVFFIHRNKPEDVGLESTQEATREGSPLIPKESVDSNGNKTLFGIGWNRQVVQTVLLLGSIYFCIKFIRYAFWSWSPYILQDSFGVINYKAGGYSALFDLGGFLGVICAGYLTDKLFNGKRNQIALIMAIGLILSCLYLYLAGSTTLLAFNIGLFCVGFMLYGPDSLVAGVGAIDVGTARAAALAAGIINGLGSIGAVLQEIVLSNLIATESGNYLNSVVALLFSLSVATVLGLLVLYFKSRKGESRF